MTSAAQDQILSKMSKNKAYPVFTLQRIFGYALRECEQNVCFLSLEYVYEEKIKEEKYFSHYLCFSLSHE